jgi:hypothetical protein
MDAPQTLVDLATISGPLGTLILGGAWWIRAGLDSLRADMAEIRVRVGELAARVSVTDRDVSHLRETIAELRGVPRVVVRDSSTPIDVSVAARGPAE